MSAKENDLLRIQEMYDSKPSRHVGGTLRINFMPYAFT